MDKGSDLNNQYVFKNAKIETAASNLLSESHEDDDTEDMPD